MQQAKNASLKAGQHLLAATLFKIFELLLF
jgi:hypothetical protein